MNEAAHAVNENERFIKIGTFNRRNIKGNI